MRCKWEAFTGSLRAAAYVRSVRNKEILSGILNHKHNFVSNQKSKHTVWFYILLANAYRKTVWLKKPYGHKKTREKSLLIVRETKFGFRYVFKRLDFEPIWSGSKKHTCGNSVSLQPLYLFDSQHFNAFFKLPSSKLRHLGPNHDSATVPLYSAKPPWNYSWGFCQSTQLLDEWQKLSTAHMIRLHKKITRESNKEIEWRSHVSYLTL